MTTTGKRSPRWAFMSVLRIERHTGEPYLTRLRIIQTPWFGIYVHRIDTPDDDEHVHDHPWNFIALILKGGYEEVFQRSVYGPRVRRNHLRWSLRYVDRTHWHKIVNLHRTPTWTLVLVGKRAEEWGFLVGGRKIRWYDYLEVDR